MEGQQPQESMVQLWHNFIWCQQVCWPAPHSEHLRECSSIMWWGLLSLKGLEIFRLKLKAGGLIFYWLTWLWWRWLIVCVLLTLEQYTYPPTSCTEDFKIEMTCYGLSVSFLSSPVRTYLIIWVGVGACLRKKQIQGSQCERVNLGREILHCVVTHEAPGPTYHNLEPALYSWESGFSHIR